MVPGEAAVGSEPREGALHRPPLGLDLEAAPVGGLADDLRLAAEDLGGPLDHAAGEAPVGPDLPDPGWSSLVHSSGRFAPSRS